MNKLIKYFLIILYIYIYIYKLIINYILSTKKIKVYFSKNVIKNNPLNTKLRIYQIFTNYTILE